MSEAVQPAPGVKVRYITTLTGADGNRIEGANHLADNPKTLEVNEDEYISITEWAFTGGTLQNTSDLIGVLHSEMLHSNQEYEYELTQGPNPWDVPIKLCKFNKRIEPLDNRLTLSRVPGLSSNYRQLLRNYIKAYSDQRCSAMGQVAP